MSRTAATIVIRAIFSARMPASLAHAAPLAKRSRSGAHGAGAARRMLNHLIDWKAQSEQLGSTI